MEHSDAWSIETHGAVTHRDVAPNSEGVNVRFEDWNLKITFMTSPAHVTTGKVNRRKEEAKKQRNNTKMDQSESKRRKSEPMGVWNRSRRPEDGKMVRKKLPTSLCMSIVSQKDGPTRLCMGRRPIGWAKPSHVCQ